MISIKSIHGEIEKILKSIIGNISQDRFNSFIHESWGEGKILFHLDEYYYPSIEFINKLDKDTRLTLLCSHCLVLSKFHSIE
jgi:hypothetical protein